MRPSLLLAVLLLANGVAFAQARPPVSRPDSVATGAPAPAAPDTLAALHRLFATRRQRRNYVAGGTALVAVGGLVIGSSGARPSGSGGGGSYGIGGGAGLDGMAIGTFFTGVVGALALGGELIYYVQYSEKNERRAVAAFEAHRLPRGLRRELKPKFFR
ncbi:hypothetical protein ACFQ48_01885 [Hymenobacter caeli]|uniref:Uncharacterized protein n=1 Tax=Hymenobacter caeli TaxID=2735894 RepID=A0ABX2FKC6_9BACT|nr:hypothetical protein [Hymenobacter caeli]NRT17573.1 hypothetical protein [Hymenobacter caeli]